MEHADLRGLGQQGQGVEVVVVAAQLRNGEGHHLIRAQLVGGGVGLVRRLVCLEGVTRRCSALQDTFGRLGQAGAGIVCQVCP